MALMELLAGGPVAEGIGAIFGGAVSFFKRKQEIAMFAEKAKFDLEKMRLEATAHAAAAEKELQLQSLLGRQNVEEAELQSASDVIKASFAGLQQALQHDAASASESVSPWVANTRAMVRPGLAIALPSMAVLFSAGVALSETVTGAPASAFAEDSAESLRALATAVITFYIGERAGHNPLSAGSRAGRSVQFPD